MATTWDPQSLLDVYPESYSFTCIGTTKKGARCRQSMFSRSDLSRASQILEDIASLRPKSSSVSSELPELAYLTLCPRWHRKPGYSQVADVVQKWQRTIKTYCASTTPTRIETSTSRPSPRIATPSRRRANLPSMPTDLPTPPPSSGRSRYSSQHPPTSPEVSPTFFESFERSAYSSDRSRSSFSHSSPSAELSLTPSERSRSSSSPSRRSRSSSSRRSRSSTVSPSSDILLADSPSGLATPPPTPPRQTGASAARTDRRDAASSSTHHHARANTDSRRSRQPNSTNLVTPLRSDSRAPSVPGPASQTRTISPPSGRQESANSDALPEPVTLEAPASVPLTPTNSYPPGTHQQSSDSSAIPLEPGISISSETASTPCPTPNHSGRRKEIDDDCGICYTPICCREDAVWCRAQCGKNLHRGCFGKWREFCLEQAAESRAAAIDQEELERVGRSKKVTCPYCRARWRWEWQD